nr:malto-oligosyltrehalose trehalohydrolase [Candidatus Nitrospira nitrificans]
MLGATVEQNGVHFRVWAPKATDVDVLLPDNRVCPLTKEARGYFSGQVADAQAGMTYRYRMDGGIALPDPCSRFQPEGPHGPSLIVDPSEYEWTDQEWEGVRMQGQVVYEMHIGAFTREGTFDAAIEKLDGLKSLGVTLLEVMPVAEFPGRWNWGYDGVDLFAPAHVYGNHHAFRRFVDAAHRRGLGVILDVVYNHFGPDGNYIPSFSDEYLTDRHPNEWGQAINFDGPGSREVRRFFVDNACYWIHEFHLDGLRLDATQAIHDFSETHILGEISQRVRQVAQPRTVILIGECESQEIRAIQPVEQGGWGLDAVWSDDFHHACRVAATGRREAYYTDYHGSPQELISLLKRCFLYQGQRYDWQRKPRGTTVKDEPANGFVFYLQNHDQVGNSVHGERLHLQTSPGRYRALLALLLLAPQTPMLFMGQESGVSNPFQFFVDYAGEEIGSQVFQGRKTFLSQFPSYATRDAQQAISDPNDSMTFERSKLNFTDDDTQAPVYRLHYDLLRLRREDIVISSQDRARVDGAVLGPQALALRYFEADGCDRLLLLNLGPDLHYVPAPEPLLAPQSNGDWRLMWSSDDPRYGGPGAPNPLTEQGWHIPSESAWLFRAESGVAALAQEGEHG